MIYPGKSTKGKPRKLFYYELGLGSCTRDNGPIEELHIHQLDLIQLIKSSLAIIGISFFLLTPSSDCAQPSTLEYHTPPPPKVSVVNWYLHLSLKYNFITLDVNE